MGEDWTEQRPLPETGLGFDWTREGSLWTVCVDNLYAEPV